MEREELPPPEYQELLPWVLREKFPAADPKLVEHAVPLVAAFGTTSVYATNFGIARFHLAQHRVKLVGEYVGRGGRSPNPEIIRAIQKWPPINTLRGWQAFLGTAHDIRAHAGPTSAHITVPLRPLLKPGGISPERRAISRHRSHQGVADRGSSFRSARRSNGLDFNKRMACGRPPPVVRARWGADTSGYAIGVVTSQCQKDKGKLRVLLMYLFAMPTELASVRSGVLGITECALRLREAPRTHSNDEGLPQSLGRVRALLVVDSSVVPANSSMEVVFRNFPELLKLQRAGLYEAMVTSKR